MASQPAAYDPLPDAWRVAALEGVAPAVLLETSAWSEESHHSLLFTGAERLLSADHAGDLPSLFTAIEAALAEGKYVAGWFAYECGYHFQGLPLVAHQEAPADSHQGLSAERRSGPLALLGVFGAPAIFDHAHASPEPMHTELTVPAAPSALAAMLHMSPAAYAAKLDQIGRWIAAGDTYQINFTTLASSRFDGSAIDLYQGLLRQQPCGYGAVLRLDPSETILSLSPELFFRVDADRSITTRPMKGTAERGSTPAMDESHAAKLVSDEKARAEHVMIVDLLRNDLGRICTTGSIHVPDLFTVERYPTLLQMTSTVRGRLRQDVSWYTVFQALFPCGSVTGAPKHHTMELIQQLEPAARGVYTGAIGYIAPDGSATFNVAIRTLTLRDGVARMGVGSGIVADSIPADEFQECLLKTRFVEGASEPLFLFETMRWHGSFPLLPLHLARLRHSSACLGFCLDEHDLLRRLDQMTGHWDGHPRRVRLTLSRSGQISLTHQPVTPWPAALRVDLSPVVMRSDDPALQHKTTFRTTYRTESARAQDEAFDEILFANELGEVTEGAISNVIAIVDGVACTPPCSCGALPGVYRQALLQRGILCERVLSLTELVTAQAVFMCNAVRGAAPVASIRSHGQVLHFARLGTNPFTLW